jgi:uncharacterized UPF0160 family protein
MFVKQRYFRRYKQRGKGESRLLIGTHHGRFHADEVFAVAILKHLDSVAKWLRSRDMKVLSKCDIVVDVGGGKYDHHTTDKQYRENGIPYASAGLIWRDFGEQVLRIWGMGEKEALSVLQAIDERLIQGIDAEDNGYHLEKDAKLKAVSEIIGSFNPTWNSDDDENLAFENAVTFAMRILDNQIRSIKSRMDAIHIVEAAFENRQQKEVLDLQTFCPWTETLLNLDKNNEVIYVTFMDKSGEYRIQVVPKTAGSFEARKPLPENWAGKENAELGQIIGIHDAVFCHPARFIAGAASKESIQKMAQIALSN